MSPAATVRAQRECAASSGTDTSTAPRFWCEHNALLTLDTSCDVQVVETIRIPWSNGTVRRTIALTTAGQTVDAASVTVTRTDAAVPAAGAVDSFQATPVPNAGGASHVLVVFGGDAGGGGGAQTWQLEYTLRNGVTRADRCSYDPYTFGTDTTDMVTAWRPEGEVVDAILALNVTFRTLRGDGANDEPGARRMLVDGAGFVSALDTATSSPRSLTRGAYQMLEFDRGESSWTNWLLFVAWHGVPGGPEAACRVVRSCIGELAVSAHERGAKNKRISVGAICGTVAGVAVLVAVACVLGWWSDRQAKARKRAPDGEGFSADGRKGGKERELEELEDGPSSLPGAGYGFAEDGEGFEEGEDFALDVEGVTVASEGLAAAEPQSPKDLLRTDFESTTLADGPKSGKQPRSAGRQHDGPRSGKAPKSDRAPKSGKAPRSDKAPRSGRIDGDR